MKCPNCGHTEFYAAQVVRGSVAVIVDANGDYLRNALADDDHIETSGLDFDAPEGPYECTKCGAVAELA